MGRRMSELGVERVTLGCESKAAGLRDLAVACGVELQEVLYVGDDVLDVPAMELAGVATAPADAHELARNVANWVTERPGGYGAVREVCDALVAARGSLEEICRRYLARV